jgi:hypothetical protein
MKKRFPVVLFLLTVGLPAQTSRDAYRGAYRAWREAEPNLERMAGEKAAGDAGAAGDALAARASHAAEEAAKYGAARGAFLQELADQQGQQVLWLQNTLPFNPAPVAPAEDELRLTGSAASLVAANISTFANDSDRGIQLLRRAMERERDALAALNADIADRQKAADKTAQAARATDQARLQALDQYRSMVAAITASAAATDQATTAWGVYYQKLSQGARGVIPQPVAPVSSTAAAGGPVASAAPAPAVAAPPPRPPSITPVPLARYVGGWTYPLVGGMFHGADPEFVDLVVHEANGHADGTFYGRFKLPPGSSGDPVIRFDFSGDFKPTRNQSFPLLTSDGAKGTVDLIPGNAFNLLEVNFQTEPVQGKVRAGDLLLVKK